MKKLIAAGFGLLLASLASSQVQQPVIATGATAARSPSDRASDIVNVRDFGALGNGTANDSAAFSAAVARVNAIDAVGSGVKAVLYIPTGQYLLNAAITQFAINIPGRVRGDGTFQTVIQLGAAFSGPVFSWSDAWGIGGPGQTNYNYSTETGGAGAEDLSIFSNTAYTGQKGLVFFDREDGVTVKNVDLWYFNGTALSFGTTKNQTSAYVRESTFSNMMIWFSGSPSAPAVSIGSTFVAGDTTNELKFYSLSIFDSGGVSLAITSSSASNATRAITFYDLRIENATGAYDQIQIGDASGGAVQQISIFGLELPAIPSGAYGIDILGTTNNIYSLKMYGASFNGAGSGININVGRGMIFHDTSFATTGTNLTVAGTNVSCCIQVDALYGPLTTSIAGGSAGAVLASVAGSSSSNIGSFKQLIPSNQDISAASWTLSGIGMFTVPHTYTDTTVTGTILNESVHSLLSPTVAATNAGVTITNLANLYVAAPIAGTNVTSPNLYAIFANGQTLTAGSIVGQGGLFVFGGNNTLSGATNINNNANFLTNIGTGSATQAVTIGGGLNPVTLNMSAAGSIKVTSNLLLSAAAPTISSGFGTAPSVTHNNGTASFSVNVGTGGTATSGVVALPTAADAWACSAADVTTSSNMTQQTGSSTTTATFTNYVRTTGVAGAWAASDILQISCFAN